MERRSFLKSIGLLGLGAFLLPKEVFSESNKNNLVNDEVTPDLDAGKIPEDLMEFARHFSENYKKLKCGIYTSDCGKYRIDYVHRRNTENKSPYGINRCTEIMDFSKSKLVNTTPSYVFNAIIWCYLIKKSPHDYVMADIKSLQCSMENGYSKKELFKNYCRIFKDAPTDLNRKRLTEIHKLIK